MSTNQERRAEARQRLREQMEAQARREKQLKIAAAAVVVVVLAGIIGVVVWNKAEEARAEEYAANWLTCEYPEDTATPEKVDPAQYEQEGPEVLAEIERFNKQVEEIADSKRDGEAPTGDQPRRGTAQVDITTNSGDIPLSLDREGAPCNVASFVNLAEQGYFDDTECHRLTVAEDGSGMSVYPRGTVAMAKSQNPNSAGSQFFLVYEDSMLPPDYTVMGTISEAGLKVLDKITDAGVKSNDQSDPDFQQPKNPVEIEKVTVSAQEGLPEK